MAHIFANGWQGFFYGCHGATTQHPSMDKAIESPTNSKIMILACCMNFGSQEKDDSFLPNPF